MAATVRRRLLGLAALAAMMGCVNPAGDQAPRAEATTGAAPVESEGEPSDLANAIVEQTNEERAQAGLDPLRVNPRLTRAARIHAEQMAAAGRLAHELPGAEHPDLDDRVDAAGYEWRRIAENIASGQRTATQVVATWMQSRTHRRHILDERFAEIGVASSRDAEGRRYYVQVFGRPRMSRQ